MTVAELIKSLEDKKKDIRSKISGVTDLEGMKDLNAQLASVDEQLDNLRSIEIPKAEPEAPAGAAQIDPSDPEAAKKRSEEVLNGAAGRVPQGGMDPIATVGDKRSTSPGIVTDATHQKALHDMFDKRGKDLKNGNSVTFNAKELRLARSVTMSGGGIVVPNQYSDSVNPTFNQVSSLVDLVHAVPLPGGESYTKGFQLPVPNSADYTDEKPTAGYVETDSKFDQVPINKTKITAYSEFSEEIKKLPNVDYQALIASDVRIALRRKMGREILIGNGQANHFIGAFNSPTNVVPANYSLPITAIDATTLDTIVFGFGGDEDVEAPTWLVLSKADLAAFAKLRNSLGLPVYKITRDNQNGNTGTISSEGSYSVNYVINSACPQLSAPTAPTAGTTCMAYGILQDYEMPVFSDIDIQISTDFKFGQGMICYRGSVFSGGCVAAWKGLMPITFGTKASA